jgi:hypothetical protein
MNTQYTPGPWLCQHGVVYRGDGKSLMLPEWENPDTTPAERDANCRLVAAAPELLDLLREVIAVYDGPQPATGGLLERIRSTIAKATGAE